MINFREVWEWVLLALVIPTGIVLFSIAISNILGRQSVDLANLDFKGLIFIEMVAVTFFYQFFFYNGTGEEVGWRGFALPRLQARTTPLIACLVLTFFWAGWHAFFWKALGEPVLTWSFWQDIFVELLPATVMINWFYNRSKGSILVAGVAHAAANTVFEYMPGLDWSVFTATMYIFAIMIVSMDQMWKKLPTEHSAVVYSPGIDNLKQ